MANLQNCHISATFTKQDARFKGNYFDKDNQQFKIYRHEGENCFSYYKLSENFDGVILPQNEYLTKTVQVNMSEVVLEKPDTPPEVFIFMGLLLLVVLACSLGTSGTQMPQG